MQKYKYSSNKFYSYLLIENYQKKDAWPDGGVDVDESIFKEFSGLPPDGMVRITGEDGYPAWGDTPPPTPVEQVEAAENEKQHRIDGANTYINSQQWPSKLALGRLDEAGKAEFNQWLDYLDELGAVDTSMAPDITWPKPPEG